MNINKTCIALLGLLTLPHASLSIADPANGSDSTAI